MNANDTRVNIENMLVFGVGVNEVDEQGNSKAIDLNDYVTLE